MMRRRQFLGSIGATAIAAPIALRAQQTTMPTIGFLNSASPEPFAHLVAGFLKGLGEQGFVEGRNIAIDYRWAEGRYERLPALAAELTSRKIVLLAATGGEGALSAARTAAPNLPIVFAIGGDPVAGGFVASLSRPGGNLTGVTQLTQSLEGKRFEFLRELTPGATAFAFLFNPEFAPAPDRMSELEAAAARAPVRLVKYSAKTDGEIDSAFARMGTLGAGPLMVAADPFFNSRRAKIVALAALHKLPAIYEFREFADAGGLMSYGSNLADSYRQVGVYAGRILKGAKPADLPVLQPTRFEFVLNLKAAKEQGISFPPALLLRADEVIE